MARTFEENMNDKKLTVKSLRVLQEVEGGAFDKISSQIEETNRTIATLQGVQNRYWDSIADDNIITVEEKRILYKEKQSLDTEYSIVIQNAEKNKDYVDYSSLTEAYQNLNSYLAFIKVFENLGSNTKIDNRTEFYDAFDSYYIALNNVNQAILNKASVGDLNVGNPDKITGLKAVASENGIYVSFNQLSSEVKNNIGKYIYKLNKGDGVIYLFESQINGFTYEFDRLVDGFPEADDIKDWEWCVSAVSVYGKENEESNIATVNVDTYGTWIPKKEDIDIILSSNKRQITFSFNRIVTNKILYGQIQFGLLVQRIDIDGENFYTPALDKNPILSEENYKQETSEPLYVTSYFSQTVPLAGQNNKKWRKKYYETREGEDGTKADSVSYSDTLSAYPDDAVITYDDKGRIIGVSYNDTIKTFTQHYEYTLVDMPSPVDTTYKYKIDVWNKDTNLHYDILNSLAVIATANSASDLVDNAITQNAIAPDAITAEKIAAGTITAEQLAAEDILVKGARAGMVSTEGLIVDDAAFLASKPLIYKYTDPNTQEEKTYKAESGEFFVGNTPILTDSSDNAEFLHFKKGQGFWLKIKNFILKGISTIIQGVFVVKSAESFNEFLIANSTDTMDEESFTPAKTLKIVGNQVSDNIFCDNVFLGKPTNQTITPVNMNYSEKFFNYEDRIFFIDDSTNKILYECDSNFEHIKLIKKFDYRKNVILVNGETIIALGGEYWNYNTEVYGVISISYDNGNTWQEIETDLNVIYGAFLVDERIFFYCAKKNVYSVYYTDDCFESYNLIFTLYNSIQTFIKTDSNIIYIGTSGLLYKSIDKGNSFTESLIDKIAVKNVLGDTLFGVETTSNSIYIKKPSSENFELLLDTDIHLSFKRDNDKLVAVRGNRLFIYDGKTLSDELFLSEISVERLVAVSSNKYLLYLSSPEDFVSINKNDKLIPIISDTNITEKNAWSSKKSFESYFPVGIIIAFAIDVNPEEAIGGFWVRISDVFLLGAGNKYGGGDIGGNETITLTENELPEHSHSMVHQHTAQSASSQIAAYSGNSAGTPSVNDSAKGKQIVFGIRNIDIAPNNDDVYTYSESPYRKWVGKTGQGNEFSILPPYLGVYYWKRVKVKYRLSFDANSGIGEMLSILEEPRTVIIPSNNFVKEGYEFVSFNTEPDGSGTTYAPGESIVLSEDIILYAIWKYEYSIPAGTYTPSVFKTLISQFISKNGSRAVMNDFTATVNSETITIPANGKVYFNASYSGVEMIGFDSKSYGSVGGSFSTYKHYIVSSTSSSFTSYENYSITIDEIIFV